MKLKIKSKSGAKKRFKITGSGKVVHKKAHLRHILTSMSSRTKRRLGKHVALNNSDARRVKTYLPYGVP